MCMFDSCVPKLIFYYISTIYKDTISELGNTAASTFPPSCGLQLSPQTVGQLGLECLRCLGFGDIREL